MPQDSFLSFFVLPGGHPGLDLLQSLAVADRLHVGEGLEQALLAEAVGGQQGFVGGAQLGQRGLPAAERLLPGSAQLSLLLLPLGPALPGGLLQGCLLYTSDAADEL